ncbi:MAG: IS1595 family transposase [Acidimicrobiales bacterium]
MLERPAAGVHYPAKLADLRAWFSTDSACLDYLDWLRWPDGFVCPHCGETTSWVLPDGRRSCGGCRRRVSATAGTIFHRTRTPLTVWFEAAWLVTTQKQGASALGLQRVLGFGSYQTAWSMLHRLRSAMVASGRQLLSGEVEVDETVIGGPRKGKRGRGAEGKTLVAVAVERAPVGKRGFGRVRLGVIADASADSLGSFITASVEPGTTVITDALSSYPNPLRAAYAHLAINVKQSGGEAHEVLPAVHRVASLLKRWLDGTHQGRVAPEHLPAYLDEFAFRFNRRRSRQPGMLFFWLLEQAVAMPSISYREMVAVPKPKKTTPRNPTGPRSRTRSLAGAPSQRPWRNSPGRQGVLHSHG